MSKINIKIVVISQDSNTVLVKYASDNSKKPIDDYPPVAFQVNKFAVNTVEEFIEEIRPLITMYVNNRDLEETPKQGLDLTSWEGYSTTVDPIEPVDPYRPTQTFPGVSESSEVIL